MTPSNTIEELVGRVEAATGPDRELAADICEAVGLKVRRHSTTRFGRRAAAWAYLAPDDRRWHAVEPILSSVDAALALAERVCPDRMVDILHESRRAMSEKFAWHVAGYEVGQINEWPRLIVLATLRSLRTKGDHNDEA